ncbi:rhodanese-like domain-containing protein [Sulfurimonas sp. C5]|uniref:sulfurtransferase n=1 Tax=Sulfurimonas sp. C5 TaxID=3036947 RepID=UPI002454C4CD|nr:rhodanese-like domain-containing protein [Sulfurimonas sp. C5]MDH4944933.1 rhodanese-like domain-containing protein [Sulfurimonas sp. C5]
MKHFLLFLIFTLSIFAHDALVSPQWLANNLHNNNIRIVEVSDEQNFELQHIKGAVHTSISQWRIKNGTYLTIRSTKEIEEEIRKLGIDADKHVVLYAPIITPKDYLKATYIYWALNYFGVTKVSVLDGGLNNWISQGFPTTQETNSVQKTDFHANIDSSKIANLDYVKSHLGKIPMLDARPSDKYLGITPTATVKRDGHIAGAMSYSWNYSVTTDYILKSKKELNALFKNGYKLNKNKELLVYCTGGLETSFNYFVLSGVLGYKQVRLYDASMKQWGNLDNTPMNKYRYETFE